MNIRYLPKTVSRSLRAENFNVEKYIVSSACNENDILKNISLLYWKEYNAYIKKIIILH